MFAFLGALFGGLISAGLTLFFGQPVQYYFWTKQRQAERQLAAIDALNSHVAEVVFLLIRGEDGEIVARAEKLLMGLSTATANIATLFPAAGDTVMTPVNEAIGAVLDAAPRMGREERNAVAGQLTAIQQGTVKTLYSEMEIPAPPFLLWLRGHVWQPFRCLVCDRPWRCWRRRGWPALRQGMVTALSKVRQSRERARQRRLHHD